MYTVCVWGLSWVNRRVGINTKAGGRQRSCNFTLARCSNWFASAGSAISLARVDFQPSFPWESPWSAPRRLGSANETAAYSSVEKGYEFLLEHAAVADHVIEGLHVLGIADVPGTNYLAGVESRLIAGNHMIAKGIDDAVVRKALAYSGDRRVFGIQYGAARAGATVQIDFPSYRTARHPRLKGAPRWIACGLPEVKCRRRMRLRPIFLAYNRRRRTS